MPRVINRTSGSSPFLSGLGQGLSNFSGAYMGKKRVDQGQQQLDLMKDYFKNMPGGAGPLGTSPLDSSMPQGMPTMPSGMPTAPTGGGILPGGAESGGWTMDPGASGQGYITELFKKAFPGYGGI